MIEGLKISISSKELKAHLADKAKHHAEKSEWYHTQAKQLEEGAEADTEMITNNPAASLGQSAKRHNQKAEYFHFLAEHIIPSEEYLLHERELEGIEIFSRF